MYKIRGFDMRLIQRLIARKRVLVIGDSHAEVFLSKRFVYSFPNIFFDICSVGGATISGLSNPNSKTNAHRIFTEKLYDDKKKDAVIILLGEVDTGFVIWYRAHKYREPIEKMLAKALVNYFSLIDKVSEKYKTIIISAPLPTIPDGDVKGEVANLRREVKASQKERTKLTLKFNSEVKRYCLGRKNTEFIDLDPVSLGKNGLVQERLLNKNRADHHYDKDAYAKLLIPFLRNILTG